VTNSFLFSLAIADLVVGGVSIPLMTVYTAMGYWPLGRTPCLAWLSIDYAMSNASVYNLMLICGDRFLALTRPLQYRPQRTLKRALKAVALAFLISILLWPPLIVCWPLIEGKIMVADDECVVQFLRTSVPVTLLTAVLAFYLPVAVLLVLYAQIFALTARRRAAMAALQEHVYESHNRGNQQGGTQLTANTCYSTTDRTSSCGDDYEDGRQG